MAGDSGSSPRVDGQTSGKRIAATLLRQALGFRDCEVQALEALCAGGVVRALGKSEVLVRRGDPFEFFCVVIEGALETSVLQQDGRRHLIAYLHPGDIAGIMSLWDGMPHPVDMAARVQPTRVLLVPGTVYRAVRDRYPSISRALELQMAWRSRLLHERMLGDTSMALDVRLARLLHLLSGISGRKQPEGVQLAMKMSQAELGDFLGVSRQRANFAVQKLKNDGLIQLNYSVITIVDAHGLAQRAGL